jgi:predicted outer membrane repeat protein
VPAFFTVTSSLDIAIDKSLTLREAITKANESGPGAHYIDFELPNNQTVITLGSQLPTITAEVYITGTLVGPATDDGPPSETRVTIERNATDSAAFRLLDVGITGDVTLSNLRLRNGKADDGGAIRAEGDVTLSGCEVLNNTASGLGGGISIKLGTLAIHNSLIKNNSAGMGGGFYFAGEHLVMSKSVVQTNTATVDGGGMYLEKLFTGEANSAVINNTEITGNVTTVGDGGGIHSSVNSVLLMGGTHIHDNNASLGVGGGIYLKSGSATFDGVFLGSDKAMTGKGMVVANQATYSEGPGKLNLYGGDDIVTEV